LPHQRRNILITKEEPDLTWDTERSSSGPRPRAKGHPPERPAVDDDRLLDHHIEEILGALSQAAVERETGQNAGDRLD
jgi:hypothetical protein